MDTSENSRVILDPLQRGQPAATRTPEQIIAKAFVKEAIQTGSQDWGEQLARKITERAEGDWRQALELARQPKIASEKVTRCVSQIGDFDRNEQNERTPDALSRLTETVIASQLVKDYLEKGFRGLDQTKQDEITKMVENRVLLVPAFREQYNNLTDPQKREFTQRLAQDPEFFRLVNENFEAILNQTALADPVTAATIEAKKTENALTDVINRAKTNSIETGNVEDALLSFDRTQENGGITKGEKARRIAELSSKRGELEVKIKTAKATLEARKQVGQAILEGRLQINSLQEVEQIPGLDPATKEAYKTIFEAEQQLQELADLQQQETALKQKKQELLTASQGLRVEERNVRAERDKRAYELEIARELRLRQEADLSRDLGSVFQTSADRLMESRVEQLVAAYDKAAQEQAATSKTELEKSVRSKIAKRWQRENKRGYNKRQIDEDFDDLLGDNLGAVVDDIVGNDKSALDQNPELREQIEAEVTRHILARRMATKGIKQSELQYIMATSWGKEAITSAIQENKDFRQAVESILGKDALKNPSFWGRFKDAIGKNPWWLLLLIVGVGIYAAQAIKEPLLKS